MAEKKIWMLVGDYVNLPMTETHVDGNSEQNPEPGKPALISKLDEERR
jgi:hypothetical protein